MSWDDWTARELADLRGAERYRECMVFDGAGPRGVVNGRSILSFASNDYLGLTQHPRVCAAAQEAIARWGTGTSASRLVTGTRPLHCELEAALARQHDVEAALVFPTGFSANLGWITTFAGADVTVFSDQLNHASIIDGCRLSKARTMVYRHLDMDHLRALLAAQVGRKIIVTETVFSMDGDLAPMAELAQIAAGHQALLVLDEAHDVWKSIRSVDLTGVEVLRVGTLSKTLASLGGWVGGPRSMIELLVNRARSFIYTTALTPADTAAALAALEICAAPEGDMLRERLRRAVDHIRPGHPSAIVPIVLGSETSALAAAATLFEHGIHVPAIRPPTVAPGTSRLRLTMSAAHDDGMLSQLRAALMAAGIRP